MCETAIHYAGIEKFPRHVEVSVNFQKFSRISHPPQLRLQDSQQTCHKIQASTDKQRMAELHTNPSSLWAFGYVCRCKEKVHACYWLVAHVVHRGRTAAGLCPRFRGFCFLLFNTTVPSVLSPPPQSYPEILCESLRFIRKTIRIRNSYRIALMG